MGLHPNRWAVVERFVNVCQLDDRIAAAFLGGSYARDGADEYSDLDLYLITTDKNFMPSGMHLHQLGELIFIEDFDIPSIVFFIFADGTEGELGLGREGLFEHLHSGPYKVLLDKRDILAGASFSDREPDPMDR